MRLKLEPIAQPDVKNLGGKGAGFSDEIETNRPSSAHYISDIVVRARGSQMRLKHLTLETHVLHLARW